VSVRDGTISDMNRSSSSAPPVRGSLLAALAAAAAASRDKGSRVPEALRLQVLARDGNTCAYCGRWAGQVDHRHPASRGGPSTALNLVACCGDCNRRKADRTKAEWDAAEARKALAARLAGVGRPRLSGAPAGGRVTPRPPTRVRRLLP
jgi:hypothetical protein